MRKLYVQDDLRLRFPGRGEEFNQGVEIGMIALLMSLGQPVFVRWLATESIEQARQVADKLGYRLVVGPSDATCVEVSFRIARARPTLRLVHSRAAPPDVP